MLSIWNLWDYNLTTNDCKWYKSGLANIVGIVLSHSRFVSGISAGSQLTRIAREANRYSEWRTAFDVTIGGFALVRMQIEQLELCAKRCTAGAFKLQHDILSLRDENAPDHKRRHCLPKDFRRQVREVCRLMIDQPNE